MRKKENTLKREPIDENLEHLFEDLEDESSVTGGNSPATNGHWEAVNRSRCSGTT